MSRIKFVWIHDDTSIDMEEFDELIELPSEISENFENVDIDYEYEPHLSAPGPFEVGTFVITSAGVLLEFYRYMRNRDNSTSEGITVEGDNIYFVESEQKQSLENLSYISGFHSGTVEDVSLEIEKEAIEDLLKEKVDESDDEKDKSTNYENK